MKKRIFILFISVLYFVLLSSCGETDYEFYGSRQGELCIYDRTYAIDDRPKSINVAVDLYRKRVKGGYEYMVKSPEGVEYKLPSSDIVKDENHNAVLFVGDFRYKNLLGILIVSPY